MRPLSDEEEKAIQIIADRMLDTRREAAGLAIRVRMLLDDVPAALRDLGATALACEKLARALRIVESDLAILSEPDQPKQGA